MKGKMGLAVVIMCVLSYFMYNYGGKKKTTDDNKERIIQGRVIDSVNENPIESVKISFQGENYKSLSNGTGDFAIFAAGNKELVFRHDKYKTTVVVAKDAKVVKMDPITESE